MYALPSIQILRNKYEFYPSGSTGNAGNVDAVKHVRHTSAYRGYVAEQLLTQSGAALI